MTSRFSLLTALLLSALFSTGCFTINAKLPGTLRGDLSDEDVEVVGTYTYEGTETFILGYGTKKSTAYYDDLMRAAAEQKADGLTNIRFESYFTQSDWILRHLTCTCISPRTYRLSGDLVRIKERPLRGNKTPEVAQSF